MLKRILLYVSGVLLTLWGVPAGLAALTDDFSKHWPIVVNLVAVVLMPLMVMVAVVPWLRGSRKLGLSRPALLSRANMVTLGTAAVAVPTALATGGTPALVAWGLPLIISMWMAEFFVRRELAQAKMERVVGAWPEWLSRAGYEGAYLGDRETMFRKVHARGPDFKLELEADMSSNAIQVNVELAGNKGLSRDHLNQWLVAARAAQKTQTDENELAVLDGLSANFVARLNPSLREALRVVAQLQSIEVRDTGLVRRIAHLPENADDLLQMVKPLADVVEALGRPIDVAEELAKNAIGDPNAGVRARNLTLLVTQHANTASAREAARCAMADANASVALTAAIFFKQDGIDRVIELIRQGKLSSDEAERAVEHMAATLPSDEALPLLTNLVQTRGPYTPALVRSLGRVGGSSAWPILKDLANAQQPELDVALAQALSHVEGTDGETLLLTLLTRPRADVRRAAVASLAKQGSARAVEGLRALADDPAPDVAEAATLAIESIQARLGPERTGGLSVAEAGAAEGALSVAVTGGLAVAEAATEDAEQTR